jgi:hypothetical protein
MDLYILQQGLNLSLFSALLWKISASSDTKNKISKLGIVVDGRTMLSFGDKEETTLMSSYLETCCPFPMVPRKWMSSLKSC